MRESEVGKDQIGRKFVQCSAKIDFGFDTTPRAGVAATSDLPRAEFRVWMLVVDDQQA
jgi:hypothetical protein